MTNLCARLSNELKAHGWQVTGIISPIVYLQGHRIGIDAIDLSNGDRRRLADIRSLPENQPDSEVITTGWNFDPETLAWGNSIFQAATPTDLLVVDELGVLEFERTQGWTEAITAVEQGQFRAALVVVRPHLLDQVQQRWPQAEVIRVWRGDEQVLQMLKEKLLDLE
jgi:nucleoside-triphosphatase THEP1